MALYEIDDYDLCRSALLECVMSDMEWADLYNIIEHAETAFEFDVSVQAQVELNQVVASFYGWENEGHGLL
jgi:hypothetical protein